MDPQACWRRILEAVEDRDQAEVDQAMRDLWDWCASGGFAPTDTGFEGEIEASHKMLLIKRRDDKLMLICYNAMLEEIGTYPFVQHKKVRFYDIKWDTDGAEVNLPTEVVLDVECTVDVLEEGADILSDKYGWCVFSFSTDTK